MAARLGNPALAVNARAAYMHGMLLVLLATAAVALLSAILTAALQLGRPTRTADTAAARFTR